MLNKIVRRNVRSFATAAANDAYAPIDHDKWYKPERPVQFSGKALTLFNSDDCKERRFVPWEIKEASFKAGMGVLGVYMLDVLFPLGPAFSIG